MSAPRYHSTQNRQNVKVLEVDPTASASPTLFGVNSCGGQKTAGCGENQVYLYTSPVTTSQSYYTAFSPSLTNESAPNSAGYNGSDDDCSITTNYKTGSTGISSLKRELKTIIYPNPAQNQITVSLAKDVADEANIKVELVTLVGAHVTNLYSGNAARLCGQSSLPLPDVAAGLYLLQVHADGKMVLNQKLSIQQ